MSLKTTLIDQIMKTEGGYVDDFIDSGGETNYGITVAVARDNGYEGLMCEMPRKFAYNIYADTYWNKVHGDQLVILSENIAKEMMDTAVNLGHCRAIKFLQRSLNVLNNRSMLYSDLLADGVIGAKTLSALAAYLEQRTDIVLVRALDCLQGSFYIELAERREKDERFVYGWLNNRVFA